MAIDSAHAKLLTLLLQALATAKSPAHALVACEDAYVAFSFGLDMGLTPAQIAENSAIVLKRGRI